ncbi:MAG: PEP-CTERM sorting domain-containing protein [Opitutales bacterium]|nr:PEP-CTERM sorting domain-containing protein [Opitutales bacterium]
MKKYITLAALLAAGTTFASANVVTIETTFANGPEAQLNLDSVSVELGSLTVTTPSTATGYSDGLWNNKALYAPKVVVNNGDVDTGWSTAFTYGTSDLELIELSSFEITLVAYNSGGTTQTYDRGARFSYELKDANGNVVLEEESVAFNIGGSSSTKLSFDFDTIETWEPFDLSKLSLTFSVLKGESTDTIQFGDTTFLYGSGERVKGSAFGVSSLSFVGVTVPEPSAFGMLAGLGALALVAARRRRK